MPSPFLLRSAEKGRKTQLDFAGLSVFLAKNRLQYSGQTS